MCLRPSPIRAYRARGFSSSSQQPVLPKASMSFLASHENVCHTKKTSAVRERSCTLDDDPVSVAWLPVEILREIFIWATARKYPDSPQRYDASGSPVNITHTCRLWRDVAIDMPILWNDIDLGPLGLHSLKMLHLWLARAQDAPLFIILDGVPGPHNVNYHSKGTTQNLECLRYLVTQSSRWQELRIYNELIANRELLALSGDHLERLQLVTWTARDWYQANEDSFSSFLHFWQVSCDAPMLRKATLSSIPLVAAWDRLTCLHFECSAFPEHIDVLRKCTNLTELVWTMEDVPLPIPLPPLVHQRIAKLSIRCFADSGSSSRLLDAFTLPSLSHLSIFEQKHRHDFTDIRGMLLRSGATLRSFTLDGNYYIPQFAALSFLRSSECQRLEKLFLPSVLTSSAFWQRFHCREASAAMLPQLSEMAIGLDRYCTTGAQAIRSALAFWASCSSCATDLRVNIYLPLTSNEYDELYDLIPDIRNKRFGAVSQGFIEHPIYDFPPLPGIALTTYDQIPYGEADDE